VLLLISCRQASAQRGTLNTVSQATVAAEVPDDDRGATGNISGTVKDPSGAVVFGGKVSIADAKSQFTQHTLTDQRGRYSFSGVPAGRYQLVVEYSGFAQTEKKVVVGAGQTTAVDITLSIASTSTVVVVAEQASEVSSSAIASDRIRTDDTASLLDEVPGVSLYTNGGVSSLPAIHGLADDRVKTMVDGMTITPHCANHMNPVLSYVVPSNVAAIHIVEGVTPVSQGGDSIAGSIDVESPVPDFAAEKKIVVHGGLSVFHRTNGVVNGGDAFWSIAGRRFSAAYNGSYVNADDYTSGAGLHVRTSLYEARNHALVLATQLGNHLLTVRLGYQDIPEQGFPNDYMDMTKNDGELLNILYKGKFAWGKVDARFYDERTRHEMNSLPERRGMDMPMNVRGGDIGYSVKAELPVFAHDLLRVGTDFHRYTLDDWWPAVVDYVSLMGPDTFWNVRNGRRDRFGTFVEWELHRGQRWAAVFGVRNDEVLMNTGNVSGYNMDPTATGSAAYYADATAFNQLNHYRVDNHFDGTALGRYQANSRSLFEFGYSRKTRSPSLYERYLWSKQSLMAVSMNGWFGDGNGYVGNLDLRPEVAHTASAGVVWQKSPDAREELKITPYYTYIQDYINVLRCPPIASSNSCTQARYEATSGYVTLQFANQTAQVAGVDASGRLPVGNYVRMGEFALSGLFSYVRGKNLSTHDNLYNIMPPNVRLALEHKRGAWSSRITLQAVDAKENVEAVRNELRTAGYALVNVQSAYQLNFARGAKLRFDLGIDNLCNRNYALPLGGRYWVDNSGSTQVPGPGRSFIGSLTLGF
jgi:iron complex outermembrane receptor protein